MVTDWLRLAAKDLAWLILAIKLLVSVASRFSIIVALKKGAPKARMMATSATVIINSMMVKPLFLVFVSMSPL
jgi:hypothetical protein